MIKKKPKMHLIYITRQCLLQHRIIIIEGFVQESGKVIYKKLFQNKYKNMKSIITMKKTINEKKIKLMSEIYSCENIPIYLM